MACLDAESIAELISEQSDPIARAAFADHAAACESCHAVVEVLFDHTQPVLGSASGDLPSKIDRYVIRRMLGAGGMGVVYVAHDPELDREVAIKMLRRGTDATRLRREAQALARLSHPNVVAVHDVGEHDGQVFVAMALVDGVNLRQWLRAPRENREILRVLLAAGRGIVAAHTAGLIHRDLKPDNIFVAASGDVLVGDFGLARDAADEREGAPAPATGSGDLTMTGTVLGTPAYMAPEQADGRATEKSDQFSFCVTAFEALYGTRPFSGRTVDEILANVRAGTITRPKRSIDATVERALQRGLRADPQARFPSMSELLRALEPRSRRAAWIAAAGVLAVGAAVATTIVVTRESVADAEDICATAGTPAWNALVRGGVLAALAAHGNTPDAIAELGRRLDQYAANWTRVRHDACVAQVSKQLTPAQAVARIACLETRKTAFEVTASSLIDSSTDVFATWKRVAVIAPPESCNRDDAAFLSSATAEHQALMRELATAVNTDSAAIAAVAKKAEATTDIPARLEIALAQAKDSLDNGALVEADTALERARPLAEGLDVVSMRVRASALSARSLCQQARHEEADRFLAIAQAGARRLKEIENGPEIDEVFEAHTECLYRRKKYAELEPLLVERLALVQRRFGRDGLEAGEIHQRLAQVYLPLERPADSAREYAASRAIEQRLVKSDEAAAVAEDGRGIEALQAGDLEAALEHSRRAIEMFKEIHHAKLPLALVSRGMLLEFAEYPAEADATFTEALALIPVDTTEEDQAVKRIEALDGRGLVRLQMGKFDAAIADVQAAIAGAEKFHRADFETSSQLTLARAWAAKREYERAVRGFRAFLEAFEKADNYTPTRHGIAQFEYAKALWETDDRDAALTMAQAAEVSVAKMRDGAAKAPLFRHLVPSSTALLSNIEQWRDQHR